jgi:hypothetical protein
VERRAGARVRLRDFLLASLRQRESGASGGGGSDSWIGGRSDRVVCRLLALSGDDDYVEVASKRDSLTVTSRWGIEPVFLKLRVLVASTFSELNSV